MHTVETAACQVLNHSARRVVAAVRICRMPIPASAGLLSPRAMMAASG